MDAITTVFSGYIPTFLTPTLIDENSGILILLFLGFCQVIAVAQILPAKVLITRMLKNFVSASKRHIQPTH